VKSAIGEGSAFNLGMSVALPIGARVPAHAGTGAQAQRKNAHAGVIATLRAALRWPAEEIPP
jgi:hypothetical protein